MRRSAFTLIELIFAIIIIAIVVVSMPLIMKTNEEAIEANIAQEAIFAASAKMMQILSYPWDSNATDQNNTGAYGKVVDVTGSSASYNRSDVNSSYRIGHIQQDNHRRFHDINASTPKLVSSLSVSTLSNSVTALNNASHYNKAFDEAKGSATGYKNDYKMDTNVTFVPDELSLSQTYNFAKEGNNTPTNMKLIKVTIKNDKNEVLTVLRSYSANIGEFDFAKRRF